MATKKPDPTGVSLYATILAGIKDKCPYMNDEAAEELAAHLLQVHVKWSKIWHDMQPELTDDVIKIDTYREDVQGGFASGRPCIGVRVTHQPTGLTFSSHSLRSVHANRAKALQMLQEALEIQRRGAKPR